MRQFDRQVAQSPHEKWWRYVHPRIKEFFTSAVAGYVNTAPNQNYIGADAQAYDRQMLPLFMIKGRGEVIQRQLIQTAPQVYVQQTPITTGIPGIAAGQVWNGALTNSGDQGPIV